MEIDETGNQEELKNDAEAVCKEEELVNTKQEPEAPGTNNQHRKRDNKHQDKQKGKKGKEDDEGERHSGGNG